MQLLLLLTRCIANGPELMMHCNSIRIAFHSSRNKTDSGYKIKNWAWIQGTQLNVSFMFHSIFCRLKAASVALNDVILLFLFTVAYLNMGASLIAMGQNQEAAKVLRKGSRLDGNGLRDRPAHDNARMSSLLQLGGLYTQQGKLQRALAVYREALHSHPSRYPLQVGPLLRLLLLLIIFFPSLYRVLCNY